MRKLSRALLAGLLGTGAALLVSCSGSGKGLIPPGNAGPLKGDFEAIAQAAQSGQGNCAATEAAIVKAVGDLGALPATVDRGLRARLQEGLTKLREDALSLCAATPSTATTAPTTTETTPTQSTTTETTPTQSTSTTNTQTTPGPGGGTPAPGEEEGGEGAPQASSQSFKHGNGQGEKHGPKAKGDALRMPTGVAP